MSYASSNVFWKGSPSACSTHLFSGLIQCTTDLCIMIPSKKKLWLYGLCLLSLIPYLTIPISALIAYVTFPCVCCFSSCFGSSIFSLSSHGGCKLLLSDPRQSFPFSRKWEHSYSTLTSWGRTDLRAPAWGLHGNQVNTTTLSQTLVVSKRPRREESVFLSLSFPLPCFLPSFLSFFLSLFLFLIFAGF